MEGAPKIRIVGNASPEENEYITDKFDQLLNNHNNSLSIEERERIRGHEYKKTEIQTAVIEGANRITSELMRGLGVEPYDIPLENIHIISSDLYNKAYPNSSIASVSYTGQGIIINAKEVRDDIVYFGSVVIHEILHLKAHLSLEIRKTSDRARTTIYRAGVTINSLQYEKMYHEHFKGLHEAIVTEAEKMLHKRLLDLPELTKEKEWLTSKKVTGWKRYTAKAEGIPDDEFKWVGKKGKKMFGFAYYDQRVVLKYVCKEIQKQFPDQYKNIDEVFREFLKAHFTGRLLTIARLVEKTFGEGSFRLLGDMNTDSKSTKLCLNHMKLSRVVQLISATETI